MERKTPQIIEVTSQQFEEILERAASNTLRDEDTELLRHIFASYAEFFQIVGDKSTTIARLRKLLFGATSETSKNVLGAAEDAPPPPPSDAADDASANSDHNQDKSSCEPSCEPSSGSSPGHGRHGADAYPGAEQVEVKHPHHYDHTVASMIGLLKYGSGLPFNRVQRLQGSCELPLAASTQWDIVHAAASLIAPA